MELWVFISLIAAALFGTIVGYILSKRISRTKPIGTLRVDTSDPDGPYLFLKLDVDVKDVYESKQVTFDVDITNYLSHK